MQIRNIEIREEIMEVKRQKSGLKKIYLASYAKVTMEKIAKHACPGAGDFGGMRAVFVPTAGDPYENRDFVEADREALRQFGAKVRDLDLKSASRAEIAEALAGAEVLLVAGGDTFYLMDWILKSGADQCIREFVARGGIYIGSSAGSIVCCPTIAGAVEFDDPGLAPDLIDYRGLGLVPGVVIPHAQKPKYHERIERAQRKLESEGLRVSLLTDEEVLYFDGVAAEVI